MGNPPLDRQEPKAARPKIGLALGGGAARGWAHIGIIRALVENGIVPDIVTGTSMGALVGGVWAAGKLDELEVWARAINKRRILGLMDFRLGGAGLINGGRLADLLLKNLGPLAIEDLPVRFAAIATEIGTGHEIWLTQGSLNDAMRASYAMPGIFSPVKVAGRWLMDGALVNPIPVSATIVDIQDDLANGGTDVPYAFRVRCRICEYETIYEVGKVQTFDREPRKRRTRKRAA